jgi:tripeptidyl-peptidase-1
MFAPHQEASDTTVDWLVESGIDSKRIKHSKGRSQGSMHEFLNWY